MRGVCPCLLRPANKAKMRAALAESNYGLLKVLIQIDQGRELTSGSDVARIRPNSPEFKSALEMLTSIPLRQKERLIDGTLLSPEDFAAQKMAPPVWMNAKLPVIYAHTLVGATEHVTTSAQYHDCLSNVVISYLTPPDVFDQMDEARKANIRPFNSYPSSQWLNLVHHVQSGIDIDNFLADMQNKIARKLSISI